MAEPLEKRLEHVDEGTLEALLILEALVAKEGFEPPPLASVLTQLNLEAVTERAERIHGGSARLLEQVRNVLTILPLVVTWFSLALAVANYGFVASGPSEYHWKPFLDLWQNRFYNQPVPLPVVSFNEVAIADVVILALLAMVSLLCQVAAYNALREAQTVRQLLQARLQALLTKIERRRGELDRAALREAIAGTSEEYKKLLESMAAERTRLQELSETREREYADLVAVTNTFKESTEALGGYAKDLKTVGVAVEVAAVSVIAAGAGLKEAVEGLGGLRADFEVSLKGVAERTEGYATAVGAVLESHRGLVEAVANLDKRLLENAEETRKRYEEVDCRAEAAREEADRRADAHREGLRALATEVTNNAGEVLTKLTGILESMPSTSEVAAEVGKTWKDLYSSEITELNSKLAVNLSEYAEALETRVVTPLLSSSLFSESATQFARVNTAVARLDGQLLDVVKYAKLLADALRGLAGATDGVTDITEDGHR